MVSYEGDGGIFSVETIKNISGLKEVDFIGKSITDYELNYTSWIDDSHSDLQDSNLASSYVLRTANIVLGCIFMFISAFANVYVFISTLIR